MALDFTVVTRERHQLGASDANIGIYVGTQHDFTFDCPGRDPTEQAILLFQSYSVGSTQVLEINGYTVWGGVPTTAGSAGGYTGLPFPNSPDLHTHSLPGGGQTGGPSGASFDNHRHELLISSVGWAGNVLLVDRGTLTETSNVLHVESSGDNFVIDNVVVVYKVEMRGAWIWWRRARGPATSSR